MARWRTALLILAGCASSPPSPPPTAAPAPGRHHVRRVGEPHLRFEAVPSAAGLDWDYWTYGAGYSALIDATRLELRGRGAPLTMELVGGDPAATGVGLERSPWLNHYTFDRGPDVAVPGFARVAYRDVYPGVAVVYRGEPGDVRYDFELAAGADPDRIRLGFPGARAVTVAADGALEVATADGTFRHRRLRAFQEHAGGVRDVAVAFAPRPDGTVGFTLGDHDPAAPLTIDPSVVWLTYTYGAGSDTGAAVGTDALGNTYVTGSTQLASVAPMYVRKLDSNGDVQVSRTVVQTTGSTQPRALAVTRGSAPTIVVAGFTTSPNLRTTAGVVQFGCPRRSTQTTCNGNRGFVATFDESLNPVRVSYLSGSTSDEINAVAVDFEGYIYVTGVARSTDFPGSPEAVVNGVVGSSVIGAFTSPQAECKLNASGQCADAFVAVLTTTLDRVRYFTYLGGAGADVGRGIAVGADAVDPLGRNLHVVGGTDGNAALPIADRFPTTAIPHRNRIFPDPFVAASGPTAPGDAFAAKIALTRRTTFHDGPSLFFSTYLGGAGTDVANAVALDGEGAIYVTGETSSSDLRETATWRSHYDLRGSSDAFVCKIGVMGCDLGYCGYLGGDGADAGRAIAVSSDGVAFVAGTTSSATGLPHVDRGFQTTCAGASCNDSFVARILPRDLQRPTDTDPIEWTSYVGGSAIDTVNAVHLDGRGFLTVVGNTTSPDLATTIAPGGGLAPREAYHGSADGFAVTLGQCGQPPVDLTQIGEGSFRGRFASGQVVAMQSRFSRDANWRFGAALSGDDGLELSDVILGERYLAERMTVPYVKVSLQGAPPGGAVRCELVTDRASHPSCSAPGACCASLVAFRGPHQVGQDKLYVEATYELDLAAEQVPQAAPDACVLITQRYELYSAQFSNRGDPSGRVKVSRFRPIVSYQYVGPPVPADQFRFYAAVRLATRPSDESSSPGMPGAGGVAAYLRDNTEFSLAPTERNITQYLVDNPMPIEGLETVIDRGVPALDFPLYNEGPLFADYYSNLIDNLHLSPQPGPIDRPNPVGLGPDYLPIMGVPGCPYCVHFHWRWDASWVLQSGIPVVLPPLYEGFPQFSPGKPLIPAGSDQTVVVGLVKVNSGEEDPPDVRALAQPARDSYTGTAEGASSLTRTCPVNSPLCQSLDTLGGLATPAPVVWFEFTGYQPQDVFFRFGGFFAARPELTTQIPGPPDGDPLAP